MLRRARSFPLLLASLAPLVVACSGGGATTGTGGGTTASSSASSGTGGQPDVGTVDDIMATLPQSCAFACEACAEPEAPFSCPTLAPWNMLPHDEACGAWDGTYPAVTPGKCTASVPTNEASRPAGALPQGGLVLPDGHRIRPAGRDFVFDEPDLEGGFPMSVTPIPGTRFALVSDGGIRDNALRLIDTDALASGGPPVSGYVPFPQPSALFYGMAWLPPGTALASGGGDGMVYGFAIDTQKGTIARDVTADILVGQGDDGTYYVGPIATTGDAQKLLVAPSAHAADLRIFSLAAADHGAQLATIPVGSRAVFDLKLDPFDPGGALFYATDQAGNRLLEIDAAGGNVKRQLDLAKNPAQLVFLDGTYLAVASSDGDELALVDRAAFTVVARVPVFEKDAPHGFSPSALAYDAKQKRIYSTLAGVNAVEVYDVVGGTPPQIVPAGRLPTAWWPTGVMARDDGSLVVVTGKGHGTGTDDKQYPWSQGPITNRMRGSVQHVPTAALDDLATQTATADEGHKLGELDGRPVITCPEGANDFPVPADNTSGPSKQIKRVILVVRENKTYDAVFGDRPDLGNGDPNLIMAGDKDVQAKIWQNARLIAEQFTNFDNFYTDAEQSIQGHTWTVYGRTTDYMERTWLSIWGRATRSVATPTTPVDTPAEGGVYQWLTDNMVSMENMGEIVGGSPLDTQYPGLVYAQSLPDTNKSCYIGGRIRLRCDLASFTYAVQSNDHTYGGDEGKAAPEVMIAVNDEASGLLLDALSHSPMWKDTLLIITEDDPQDGGDHIDLHRSLLIMASPWIKRGYVSHGHYDMASVYKLVAHIFGIPYHNDMIRNAMAPFDAFTSTPDYTPFTYLPRKVAAPCNKDGKHAKRALAWDFDDLDDQPGLSQQIMEMMREPKEARGVRVIK
ncbi:MAG: bifunctional YncE family protein/alkaline phosphatase family protein [Minicystis sp.]